MLIPRVSQILLLLVTQENIRHRTGFLLDMVNTGASTKKAGKRATLTGRSRVHA
jgi:hypothetical protein